MWPRQLVGVDEDRPRPADLAPRNARERNALFVVSPLVDVGARDAAARAIDNLSGAVPPPTDLERR
jgi:hypothetical protein